MLALLFYAFIVSVDIFIIHTISVTSISLRQERQALAVLAAKKEQENVLLLENEAYQREMSLELAHRMKNQLALVSNCFPDVEIHDRRGSVVGRLEWSHYRLGKSA